MPSNKPVELNFLPVGRVLRPHGIRGEVKVEILTDFPERFNAGVEIYLGSETKARRVQISGSRPHQGGMLVSLVGVDDRNAAEALRDQMLLIRNEQAMPLGEHENYAHDLVGLQVETVDGLVLGQVTEVLSAGGANDVYEVTDGEREILIPALREVVIAVDLTQKRMIVSLPEGLLD